MKITRTFLIRGLAIAALAGVIASCPLSAEDDLAPPREVVDKLQNEIIEIMKVGQEVGFNGRYDRFYPIITSTHRLETIARLTVGRYWGEQTDATREDFVDHFTRYIVSSYASKFKKYKGEFFEMTGARELKPGQVLVESDLHLVDDDPVRFRFILSNATGEWLIVNVMVEGISDLALKRAEYTSVIKKDGFDALLVKIEDQIADIKERNLDKERELSST